MLLAGVILLAVVEGSQLTDLQRARAKVPRSDYQGHSFANMGDALNKHLVAQYGGKVHRCTDTSVAELREIQTRLFSVSHPELLEVYARSSDGRQERHASVEELRVHWDALEGNTTESAILRDGLCHDVVLRFAHHLSQSTRDALMAHGSFWIPSLPKHRHTNNGRKDLQQAFREYDIITFCANCHSRLVPVPSPPVSDVCNDDLTTVCGKRGMLGAVACADCVSQSDALLQSCTGDEVQSWCDHPDACMGSDECPIWPTEFNAPFTLYADAPSIVAAKSVFYYKYTSEVQAQTVAYNEVCFPGVTSSSLPCNLTFNPDGIFLMQPGLVDCCQVIAGVGAVPPEFLQRMTLLAHDVEQYDMYGNSVKCDEWDGLGFKYYTVGHDDALYSNWGHDIFFADAGTQNATWRWGNFEVKSQADELFELPTQCDVACSSVFSALQMEGLRSDPHVRRALHHHHSRHGVVV